MQRVTRALPSKHAATIGALLSTACSCTNLQGRRSATWTAQCTAQQSSALHSTIGSCQPSASRQQACAVPPSSPPLQNASMARHADTNSAWIRNTHPKRTRTCSVEFILTPGGVCGRDAENESSCAAPALAAVLPWRMEVLRMRSSMSGMLAAESEGERVMSSWGCVVEHTNTNKSQWSWCQTCGRHHGDIQ